MREVRSDFENFGKIRRKKREKEMLKFQKGLNQKIDKEKREILKIYENQSYFRKELTERES